MTDDEFVAALRDVFDATEPPPGVDRHDGHGRDYRITGLAVVPSDDGFDDLEVSVQVGSQTVVSRLLFDRSWREDSGLDDVDAYAVFVARRWQFSQVQAASGAEPAGDGELQLWELLRTELARNAAGLHSVRHGVEEVVDEDGDVVTIHVTPQQWRRYAAGRSELALEELDERIGSRWDDEDHIVFFRGSFHCSVRAELPPVRSRLQPR